MITSASSSRISIHSPHARGDPGTSRSASPPSDFNPLPSCEGRLIRDGLSLEYYSFQSTPLMRGETRSAGKRMKASLFQSTPLMRGETAFQRERYPFLAISIHSPHARGDAQAESCLCSRGYFNPLPSCEGRPTCFCRCKPSRNFNPLPSCEGRRLTV